MDKVRLGDIATLINGDRGKNYPSQADITDEGDIPFVNAGHLNGRSIDFEEMNYISQDKYDRLSSGKFVKGDVLYCLRGSLGKKAIVKDEVEGAIASSLVIIRPDHNRIDGDYLMYSLDSPAIKEQLTKVNNGSSQPNLSAASVREYQIELPEMQTQKTVVEKLERVRGVIDSRQHELGMLDELIKARFVELFGDPIHNEMGWDTATVESVCKEIFGGGTPSKSHPEYYENGDIPWVSSKDMKTDVLTKSQIYINQKGVDNSTARMAPVNSVIMVIRSGILKHTLPVAINAVPITVNQDLKVFIPGELMLSRFMAVQFKMQEADILSGVRAVTADNIEFNSLKQRALIVPPIELQKEYVDFLEQLDKSKVAVQKSLDETQKLFDSLMQEYFE